MKNFPSLSLLTSSLSPLNPSSLSSVQSKYQELSLKASPPKYGSCSGCQPCPSCHPPVVNNVNNNTFTAYKGDGRVHPHAEGDCHWAAKQPGVSETACSGWESPQWGCWGQQGARVVVRILVHLSFNISVWFKTTAGDEYVQEFANWSMILFSGSENWGPTTPSVWGVQVEFWGNRGGQS